MTLYAESSAILAWLLGESKADAVREIIDHAELVTASVLTLIECDRAIHRAVALGGMSEASASDRRTNLYSRTARWQVIEVTADVTERAKRPFPVEPVRTIDALHLASALAVRFVVPDLEILSFDNRVRRNGEQLGFGLQPG